MRQIGAAMGRLELGKNGPVMRQVIMQKPTTIQGETVWFAANVVHKICGK
jgi:hypothetical protein